jgi:hypothetical protein
VFSDDVGCGELVLHACFGVLRGDDEESEGKRVSSILGASSTPLEDGDGLWCIYSLFPHWSIGEEAQGSG